MKALQFPPCCSLSSLATCEIGLDAINMGESSWLESGLSTESLMTPVGLQVGTMHCNRCGHMELLRAVVPVVKVPRQPVCFLNYQ